MSPKNDFHAACLTYIQLRVEAARIGMAAAQESSNSETKSSAGDKYETGRAMAQQERDHHAQQLHEAQKLLADLQKINPYLVADTVRLGALISTSMGLFYVSISAGQLTTLAGQQFMAISPAAPLAAALYGCRVGEEHLINGKLVQVLAIV